MTRLMQHFNSPAHYLIIMKREIEIANSVIVLDTLTEAFFAWDCVLEEIFLVAFGFTINAGKNLIENVFGDERIR